MIISICGGITVGVILIAIALWYRKTKSRPRLNGFPSGNNNEGETLSTKWCTVRESGNSRKVGATIN